MHVTKQLHDLGQSIWLDHITRGLLKSGTLRAYLGQLSVSGLTSNPTIFEHAIRNSAVYDAAIREKVQAGLVGEDLFFELALEDLRLAADHFRLIHQRTHGTDGWVSLEVSPLLADDSAATIEAASRLFAHAGRDNLFIKIPGTQAGLPAIEASIFAGVPVNVTLLFSPEHYLAAAEAYMRGIEHRIAVGRDPVVHSVASLFVSRWDVAIRDRVGPELQNRLGIAIARRTYQNYRSLLTSARWQKLAEAGARPQRLLFASTGTKDQAVSETLYVEALAAPDTINTMPEKTLLAFADRGVLKGMLTDDDETARATQSTLAEFASAGIDTTTLAASLQREGADAFVKSWHGLMACMAAKSAAHELPSLH